MVTEKMIEAAAARLKQNIADAEYEMHQDFIDAQTTGERPDLHDYEVSLTLGDAKALEAALSTDAEPVAWWWEDATGCLHIVMDRPDVKQMAAVVGCEPNPLYDRPQQPTPSVAVKVKQLEWKEDGKYLRARMGDREYSLNITADGKTWAGATRPYAFGANLTWSSVPNCSMVSLEEAKASCQADCQSRHDALSAQVQDVAEEVREAATEVISAHECGMLRQTSWWQNAAFLLAQYAMKTGDYAAPATKLEGKP